MIKKKKLSIVCILTIFLVFSFMFEQSFFHQLTEKIVPYEGSNLMISVDGVGSATLPTSGNYYLASYECSSSATKLTWDRETKTLKVSNGKKNGNAVCNLNFQSKPKLTEIAEAGSYVIYVGNNGCTGIACEGYNANYANESKMGYCNSTNEQFLVNGWRVAYIKDQTAHLISAGSPECFCTDSSGAVGTSCSSSESTANLPSHLSNLNTKAQSYCNADYAYGGTCDENSAWNMNATDFRTITGTVLSSLSCYGSYSNMKCGYSNDLIDNGSNYWVATVNGTNTIQSFYWIAADRQISSSATAGVMGLRPIVRLASTVVVVDGEGTYDDPYQIANYSFTVTTSE